MIEPQKIEALFSENKIEEAIRQLDICIESQPGNSQWHFLRGKAYWRMGQKGKAISDYEQAVALDPDSPARLALEMARDVMNFFNPDLYNP